MTEFYKYRNSFYTMLVDFVSWLVYNNVIYSQHVCILCRICFINGWQLAKMKKSIPDMALPWNL